MNDYNDWTVEELQLEIAQLEDEKWRIEDMLHEIFEELSSRGDDE